MILKIKNLTVEYFPKVKALNAISFDVFADEVLAIVGESGSGKTTLAYSLMNLLPKDSRLTGEIIFNQQNLVELTQDQWQKIRGNQIGMIMQDPAAVFNPVLSLGYQFKEMLEAKSLSSMEKSKIKKIIQDSLDLVHLPDKARMLNSFPHQLSGGQLQRIAIAMAISLNPKILIADEPTSSLDVTLESKMVNLLNDLRKQLKLTIVLITHNLGLAQALSTRVLVLAKGEIQEIDETKQLLSRPNSQYAKALVSAYQKIEG